MNVSADPPLVDVPVDAAWRQIDVMPTRFYDDTTHTSWLATRWLAEWRVDGQRFGYWEWRKI